MTNCALSHPVPLSCLSLTLLTLSFDLEGGRKLLTHVDLDHTSEKQTDQSSHTQLPTAHHTQTFVSLPHTRSLTIGKVLSRVWVWLCFSYHFIRSQCLVLGILLLSVTVKFHSLSLLPLILHIHTHTLPLTVNVWSLDNPSISLGLSFSFLLSSLKFFSSA